MELFYRALEAVNLETEDMWQASEIFAKRLAELLQSEWRITNMVYYSHPEWRERFAENLSFEMVRKKADELAGIFWDIADDAKARDIKIVMEEENGEEKTLRLEFRGKPAVESASEIREVLTVFLRRCEP